MTAPTVYLFKVTYIAGQGPGNRRDDYIEAATMEDAIQAWRGFEAPQKWQVRGLLCVECISWGPVKRAAP